MRWDSHVSLIARRCTTVVLLSLLWTSTQRAQPVIPCASQHAVMRRRSTVLAVKPFDLGVGLRHRARPSREPLRGSFAALDGLRAPPPELAMIDGSSCRGAASLTFVVSECVAQRRIDLYH